MVLKKHKFYLRANALTEDVPLVIFFKAMGIESAQEIVQLVGTSTEAMEAFSGSIELCHELQIFTASQV